MEALGNKSGGTGALRWVTPHRAGRGAQKEWGNPQKAWKNPRKASRSGLLSPPEGRHRDTGGVPPPPPGPRAALTVQQQQPLKGTEGQQRSGPGQHPGAGPGACPEPAGEVFLRSHKSGKSRSGEGGKRTRSAGDPTC